MPKDTILLKNIGWIYTFNVRNEIIRNGFLLLKGEKIEQIGLAKDPLPPADKVIDLEGAVLLPGLINVHHHFYQNITRAVPKTLKCSLLEWLKYLYALWAFLEPEDIKLATQIAVSELLLSGSTTTSDFFYLFPHHQYDLFDLEVKTALDMGIRLHAIRGCLPVLEGALSTQLKEIRIDPAWLVEDKENILKESERVIDKFHDPSFFAMTQVGLGPTTVDYGDAGFARELKGITARNNGIFSFHLHPREDERELCKKLHNSTPNEYLESLGWFDGNVWVAHATNHGKEDIEVLARNNVRVTHSPSCHLRLGYRVAPIPEMIKRGIIVGIGVDGGASNDSGNLLAELRTTLLVHRIPTVHPHLSREEWFTPEEVFKMATLNGAKMLSRETALGSLEVGKAADLVAWNLNKIGSAGSFGDPLSTLLLCGLDYRVDFSMVNGKPLVHKGVLLAAEEKSLAEEAKRVVNKLLKKAESVTGLSFSKLED